MLSQEQQSKLELAVQDYINNENKSARQIAREYGFSKDRITNILNSRGLMRKKKDNSFDYNYFNTIDTEEKAYWLGFIYADGCVWSKENCLEIVIQYKDYEHLVKFKNMINFKGDIKTKWVTLNEKRYKACRIRLFHKQLKQDLVNQGVKPRKSLRVVFPSIFRSDLIRHFIRGYFDGNGSVIFNKDSTIGISISSTKPFLVSIQNKFIKYAKVSKVKIYDDKRSQIKSYRKNDSQALKILHYLYDDSNLYLDRKYNKFMKFARGSKIGRAYPEREIRSTEVTKEIKESLEP
mgnify:CR=1 FL=1|jgi:hypothetical protein